LRTVLAVICTACAAFAQYGGPAILSRGDAPAAMTGADVSFRPFVEVSAVYSTGLAAGVALDSAGNIANHSSIGAQISGGISGAHNWRHTTLGISYRGSYSRYTSNEKFSSTDQSLLLGLRRQLSPHVVLSIDESAGIFNRNAGLLATISPSVPFDPAQSYVPTTDFFDNRTIFSSTQIGMAVQRSTRTSWSFSGGLFDTHRQSAALYGVIGENASADYQYRITKRMTIGGNYNYSHFGYGRLASDTNMHGGSGSLAYQMSRFWEFTGYAGFYRVESKFIQNVPVDPAIAAIIGITQSSEVVYTVRYTPNFSARLSRTFHKGVLYFYGGHTVTPGNGLFLTSTAYAAGSGYTYTGLRKWSFGATGSYHDSDSIGNVQGGYASVVGVAHMSRQVARSMHAILSFNVQRYSSGTFAKYNNVVYSGSLGLGWSPGVVPLRIW